jgi:exosortase/archaeosortase family protein
VGCALSQLRFGRCLHPGILGLLYLSLPVIPSLQFYGGYPLRAFLAAFTAPILRMSGYAVVQEGTCLNWAGKLIWVDAPCSGIRMLWVGLYLTCTLVCLYELSPLKTLLALAAALVVIMFGNVFRATALFYVEAGNFEVPHWTHDYAGVVAFAVVACVIVASVRQIGRIKQCDTVSST